MKTRQLWKRCLSQEQISALLDGELGSPELTAAEEHLDQCAECRRVRDELDELRHGLAGLLECDEPAPLMWSRIAQKHAEQSEHRVAWWRGPWLLAPLAAVAAAVLIVMAVGSQDPVDRDSAELAQAYAGVLQAERTYVKAIDALQQVAVAQGKASSPAVQQALAMGLAEIDATIAHCRQRLRGAPQDFQAHRMLLAAYQRKVDFLNDVVGPSI